MNNPVQITFRNMDPSRALTEVIEERAARLDHYWNRIIGCRVAVEAPHRVNGHSPGYHVRLEISVPGKDIVVGKEPSASMVHDDVYTAVNLVFDTAKRQLLRYAQKRKPNLRRRRAARSQLKRSGLVGEWGFGSPFLPVEPSPPTLHAR